MNDELTEARERVAAWAADLDMSAEIALRKPELASTGPRVASYTARAADLRTLLAALDQRDKEVEELRGMLADEHGVTQHSIEKAVEEEIARQAAEQRLKAVTEALEPFIKLAAETLTPGSPDYQEWLSEAKDWMIIFAFAGRSVTLGDLRRTAALAAAQAPAGENSDEQ